MADFSKLSNLYNAQKRFLAYSTNSKKRTDEQKQLADANNDGKIDSKDQKILKDNLKNANNDKNVFDFNNDGKTDLADFMLLNSDGMDFDGDGKISEEEKEFIKNQLEGTKSLVGGQTIANLRDTVEKTLAKEKTTCVIGDIYYENGKKATGTKVYNNTLYKNGVKSTKTEVYKDALYIKGEKATGTQVYNNVLYRNGAKATGTQVFNNVLYENGKKSIGTKVYDNTLYKNGVKSTKTEVYKNVLYLNGTKATGTQVYNNVLYKNGAKATGTQVYNNVLYENGKKSTGTKLYNNILYKNGVKSTKTEVYKDVLYVKGEVATGIVTYNNVTYKDGAKLSGFNDNDFKFYDKGKLYTGTKNGVVYKKGVAYTDNKKKTTLTGQGKDGNYYVNGLLSKPVLKNDGVYSHGQKIISLNKGDKATILDDGNIQVISLPVKSYNEYGDEHNVTTTTLYNKSGLKLSEEEYNNYHTVDDFEGHEITTTNYYANGNIKNSVYKDYPYHSNECSVSNIEKYYENGNIKEYEFVQNGEYYIHTSLKFNDDGNIIYNEQENYMTPKIVSEYEYYDNSNNIKNYKITEYDKNNQIKSKTISNCNEFGFETNITSYSYDNGILATKTYEEYDSFGTLVSAQYIKYASDGKSVEQTTEINKKYNDFYNILEEKSVTTNCDGEIIEKSTISYEYMDIPLDGYDDETIFNRVLTHKRNESYSTINPKNDYTLDITYSYDNQGNIKEINRNFDDDNDGIYDKTTKFSDLNYLNYRFNCLLGSIDTADISDRVKDDIEIVKNAEEIAKQAGVKGAAAYETAYNNAIKEQMIKTPETMENVVGEIVEKTDGLYVNNGNELVKLDISSDTYLKLFPPIERYDVLQNSIGDCYFVSGCLVDMLKNPKAFSELIQMFSEDENGNITIQFEGSLKDYPVTFNNGELYSLDGITGTGEEMWWQYEQVTGSTGLQLIEQAYAMARFTKESTEEISSIDIDDAITVIEGGFQSNVYSEILADDKGHYYYNNLCQPDFIEAWDKQYGIISDDSRIEDTESFIYNLADEINNGEMLFSIGFWENNDEYDIYSNHAYSVEKIDLDNNMIYITNPWYGGGIIGVPIEEIAKLPVSVNILDLSELA